RHAAISYSAGDHQVEVGEIGIHIQRQPVHGHPTAAPDPHRAELTLGADLIRAYPDARPVLDPPCVETEIATGQHHRLLERPKVAVDVREDASEIEDRITDELTGPMKGDVAAPIDVNQFGATLRELRLGDE